LKNFVVDGGSEKTKYGVIFIIHVDPRPAGIHWVFHCVTAEITVLSTKSFTVAQLTSKKSL
jgi:hypothetical protein